MYNSTFLPLLEWSITVSTITGADAGLLYQPRMMDDDKCLSVGGMNGRETEVLGVNLH
jgi:hypothetical protein